MNLYKKKIYKSHLQHGLEWKKHKYLYKDANGNYVYPDDVKNGGHSSGSKFFGDSKLSKNDHRKGHGKVRQAQSDRQKAINQGTKSANGTHWFSRGGMEAYLDSNHYKNSDEYKLDNARRKNSADYIEGMKSVQESNRKYKRAVNPTDKDWDVFKTQDKQKKKTKQRKEIAKAHQGYTEDRKNFPDGGSTEELERQKQKTKERKREKERFKAKESANKRTATVGYVNKLSSKMDHDRNQSEQISSAHQTSVKFRKDPEQETNRSKREWDHRILSDVKYRDDSGSIERQKRKTALRKRHKK